MWLYLILGLIILAFSGDMLVRGSVDLSKILKVSPFIIAGTLVAFGTSIPELFVSVMASIEGSPEAAIGNILGSNFANVFLALGAAAFINVILPPKNMNYIDIIILLVFSIVFAFILLNLSSISIWLGLALFLTLIIYLFYTIKNKSINENEDLSSHNLNVSKSIFIFILGLVGILFGSKLLVTGSIDIAKYYGIRETVIGIVILALGTSLPEVVTSIVASIKKEYNIAIGNIVGSSIFNILAIGGSVLLIADKSDIEITSISVFDLIPFLLATIILLLFYKFKFTITKLYGFLLVMFYIIWISLIFLY